MKRVFCIMVSISIIAFPFARNKSIDEMILRQESKFEITMVIMHSFNSEVFSVIRISELFLELSVYYKLHKIGFIIIFYLKIFFIKLILQNYILIVYS